MAKVNIDLSFIPARQSPSQMKDFQSYYADCVDILRTRAVILSHRDRALIQMYLGGHSFSEMAHLMGVNEAKIARRIHKLLPRLVDSEYITCIRHRKRFSSLERTLAKDYFIEGLSQKKIAQKRDISIYRVRKSLRKIRKFVRELNRKNRIQNDINVQSKEEYSVVGTVDRQSCFGDENVRSQS